MRSKLKCVIMMMLVMLALCIKCEAKPTDTNDIVLTAGAGTILEDDIEIVVIRGWSMTDKYLLAKIAMAEAEGCNIETKAAVIQTVINRVDSEQFPDTVEEVLYEHHKGVYQFSPMSDGRWDNIEPNEECYEVIGKSDTDALYFESCSSKNNWHSRNLELILETDKMRFYK